MARCLEWKHLTIRLALVWDFLTTVQICCDIVSLLSIKMPKSRISKTRLTLACLITQHWLTSVWPRHNTADFLLDMESCHWSDQATSASRLLCSSCLVCIIEYSFKPSVVKLLFVSLWIYCFQFLTDIFGVTRLGLVPNNRISGYRTIAASVLQVVSVHVTKPTASKQLILISYLESTYSLQLAFGFGQPFVKRFALCYRSVVCL